MIEAYVDAGLSKFVVRPAAAAPGADRFIGEFADQLLPLEN